jgi:hypothetical protein
MIKNYGIKGNRTLLFAISVMFICYLFYSLNAYPGTSDDLGFDIGGVDKSASFSTFKNFLHTIAVFAVQYIARIIGACLCIYGLFTAAIKDKIAGIVAISFGAVLLFLPTVLQQVIKFGNES